MAYPTGFEQLLDAVRSWEAPYFKQKELGQNKAKFEGQMQLDLAKLDLANKQAIVDNALKRTQTAQAKVALEEAKKELALIDDKWAEQKKMDAGQLEYWKKLGAAAVMNAANKGGLSIKEKKINDFTSRLNNAVMAAIQQTQKKDMTFDKFRDWWVGQNMPGDVLTEIEGLYDKIRANPDNYQAWGQLRNFFFNKMFNPVLAEVGLQPVDVPEYTRRMYYPQYDFSGLKFPEGEAVPRRTGLLGGLFSRKVQQEPTVPSRQEAPIPPKTESPTGQVGILGVLPQGVGNNIYGGNNMLASKKPAEGSTGVTKSWGGGQVQQAGTGLGVLKPSSLNEEQLQPVYYNGKVYYVNPVTKEVFDENKKKVWLLHKNAILRTFEEGQRGGKGR